MPRARSVPEREVLHDPERGILEAVLLFQMSLGQCQMCSLQFVGAELPLANERPGFLGQAMNELCSEFYRQRARDSGDVRPPRMDASSHAVPCIQNGPPPAGGGQHAAGRKTGRTGADNQAIVVSRLRQLHSS